ncbi:hypothetical protein CLAIMM_11172 [Cladophialophora immunda]|nr:hypothetical protein CLAIMM_11172 [Cladophialophora immunda]
MIDKPNTKDFFDVVVVGAGMAGVVATRDLASQGYSVALLEARSRVGGRTFVEKAFGGTVDLELGGAYVHWTQPHVWHELSRHKIPLLPPLESNKCYWLADDTVHSGTTAEYEAAVGPLLERFFADARSRFPSPFDVTLMDNNDIEKQSLQDRIDSLKLTPYERDLLDGTLSGVVHSYEEQGLAQLLQAVATYFGNFGAFLETAGTWSIQGGTKCLIDAILAQSPADVRLSTVVDSITDEGTRVTVMSTSGEVIHARSVIVALPLNTLGDVKITPDVPSPVRTMIDQKNPVMATKIWARVKGEIEPFSMCAPVGKHPINAARTESRHAGDTLIFAMVSDAAAIRADDRNAVQAALQKFVPDIQVIATAGHNWAEDKFSKGGWMMHRPGNLTGAAPQMRQLHGRLRFAGSDIATMEPGSIEGAMESGAAAARDIVTLLGINKC